MFCFPFICGKKNTVSSLVSVPDLASTSTASTETSSEKSTMKKQRGAKKRSVRNGKKKVPNSAKASIKRSKTLAVTSRDASMKLLAGSSPCKTSNTNNKTTTNSTDKSAESKKASLKPTLPPGTNIEQTDAKAQTRLQSSMKAKAERRNTTTHGPMKKTAAKKDISNSNKLNMEKAETRKVCVRTSSKLPGTKHIKVKEADETSKLKSLFGTIAVSTAKEERQMTTLHNQERNEKSMQTSLYNWKNLEHFNQKLKELNFSYDVKKSTSVPNAFSSNKMMALRKTESTTLTPFVKKSLAPPSYDGKSLDSPPFVGNTKRLTSADENNMTPTLSSATDKQVLPGGLPNLGNSCYINASLQCLLTAKAFCEELSHLLDVSSRTTDDTFLRCFAELSRLRNGCEVRGDFNKDSLLLALINSTTAVKREFTIYEQNDAHEFLCHCLTHMERSGQGQGWQKHVHPRCPVKTNFRFKMRNIITCSSCGAQQNNKVDVFNHISVPLVYSSVDQCLYDLVNEATEVESKCNLCRGEFAKSRWTFHTLPRFLILQLNRFRLSEHHTVIKVDTSVNIQPELQIHCLPQSDMTGSDNSTAESQVERDTGRNELCGPPSIYRLISVLSHFGSSAEYGHYVSDCFNHNSHEWMIYDDDQVTPTTETHVLQRRSSNAYVLLYERLDTG